MPSAISSDRGMGERGESSPISSAHRMSCQVRRPSQAFRLLPSLERIHSKPIPAFLVRLLGKYVQYIRGLCMDCLLMPQERARGRGWMRAKRPRRRARGAAWGKSASLLDNVFISQKI